jgi:hypothetical protein
VSTTTAAAPLHPDMVTFFDGMCALLAHFRAYSRELSQRCGVRESRPGFVYFVQAGQDGPIKIGFAANVGARLSELQTASPEPLTVLATIEGTLQTEAEVHRYFQAYRLRGEWFRADVVLLGLIGSIQAGL